ncbi:MAG: hypothetical protein KC609_08575 [Myxococcales bacterium]|nr:hypothetical protein [Myxococcales bacterium]
MSDRAKLLGRVLLGVCFLSFVGIHPALADGEVSRGTVSVKLNVTYPKFTLDGKAWENHHFLDDGAQLVILNVPTNVDHTVVIKALDGRQATLVIKSKRWRKKRNRKTKVIDFSFKTKVTLKKAASKKK